MNGCTGKLLRVNLSNGSIAVEQPGELFYRHYFGGRGIISYVLLEELPRGVDPLSPENRLVFAAGPVTGVPVIGSGRNSVGAKSPLTGLYGDGEVGGFWGAEMKRAGYDAIIVEGRAAAPAYLWISDDKAEIRDARHLWGQTTGQCEKAIREELGDGDIRVAQIGIAGENLVRFACVINDLRDACGRSGMGAVMGSKNLKAIAVRGHHDVPVADAEGVGAVARWYRDNFRNSKWLASLSARGTVGNFAYFSKIGVLPARNFQEGGFAGADKISFEAMAAGALKGHRGCYACPVRCKAVVSVSGEYGVDPMYGGPEYETQAAFGSTCGVDSLEAVLKASELCNAYSLDSISAGVTIAFAMECFERGILTEKDSGGLPLRFGNADAMLKAIEMIARRQGLGNVLAEGCARAARAIGRGAEGLAMHVKGMEIPMHEPRWKHGTGLGYTVAPIGADHNDNIHDSSFERRVAGHFASLGVFEPLSLTDLTPAKVRLLVYGTAWKSLFNCLVVCNFIDFSVQEVVDLVRSVTGWDTSAFELMKMGERSMQMVRAFNVREGLSVADEKLPERFFAPFPSGPMRGVKIDKAALAEAKETYYDMMGWDRKTGAPALGKLQELGIEWVAPAEK